jgi:epoxide hydrolase-like predicted phosphatase
MSLQAIILDLGGVLLLPPKREKLERWASRCGLSVRELGKSLYETPIHLKVINGEIDVAEAWTLVGQQLGLEGEELTQMMADCWNGTWDEELAKTIRLLKPRYRLALLSNASAGIRDAVHEALGKDYFDLIVISAEEKCSKPERQIFELTLARLGVDANRAVFVDDVRENVDAARQLGMHGIHYQNQAQLLAELESLGVSTPPDPRA